MYWSVSQSDLSRRGCLGYDGGKQLTMVCVVGNQSGSCVWQSLPKVVLLGRLLLGDLDGLLDIAAWPQDPAVWPTGSRGMAAGSRGFAAGSCGLWV